MKKVLLRGPFLVTAGYGTQARTILRALRQFPDRFDLYLINTSWGTCSWTWEDNEERRWIDSVLMKTIQYQQQGGQFDISIQVTVPHEWQRLAPINIGYTAGIETTKISTKWFEASMHMNKIIFTSNHAKYAFEKTQYPVQYPNGQQVIAKLEVPMEVIGYPVIHRESKEIDLDLKYDFNFLVVAQWSPRKNIEGTIKCFVEEFLDKEVGLILKLSSMNGSKIDRELTEGRIKDILKQYPDRKCAVHFLHGDLTEEEMTYLYRHPKVKCLVNLSHGEGFSLTPFEALYNALPVCTIAWGGQNDFIFMPGKDGKEQCMVANVAYDLKQIQPEAIWEHVLIPESQWAFPKEWHAKAQMRDVYKNWGTYKSKANKLKKHLEEKFELSKINRQFADAIYEDMNEVNIMDILNEETKNPYVDEVVEL